ncbi:glutamate 5-kinase [Desulfarculus baarsii]
MTRPEIIAAARRVVVKVGSGVLTGPQGLDKRRVELLSGQLARLRAAGRQVLLVSSGAIASGRAKVGLAALRSIPEKQAAAALGQAGLMQTYEDALEAHGLLAAQILLTAGDLRSRHRYLNARNTINTLLDWGVIPIVNENDTVAVDEIKLGDNDNLAAMLTNLLGAPLMVNLTNVDGILDADPRTNPQAKLIPVVERVDAALLKAASAQPGAVGRGGIFSKVKAADKVARCGACTIVANGLVDDILDRLFAGQELGTFFLARSHPLSSRKHWIAFTACQNQTGVVVVDQGAVAPLSAGGKSLLAAGVSAVRGRFGPGAAVKVVGPDGRTIGVGLCNYSSADLEKIKGLRSGEIERSLGHKDFDEVIHRDNLVVFGPDEKESVECLLSN